MDREVASVIAWSRCLLDDLLQAGQDGRSIFLGGFGKPFPATPENGLTVIDGTVEGLIAAFRSLDK